MTSHVALLGGSFSPVHAGHIIVASFIAQFVEGIDQVWLIPAARNPLKPEPYLLSDCERLSLLIRAVEGSAHLSVSDVEFSMPVPSYTIDTLKRLSGLYPEIHFHWIVGSDNWQQIQLWKDWQTIIERFGLIVYPRPGYPVDKASLPDGVRLIDAPLVELSSTFIRGGLAQGKDMSAFLPAGVWPLLVEFLNFK